MFKLLCSALFILFFIQAKSQLLISDAEVMLQSRHIWRGTKLGSKPVIEPSVTISANRFSFNFWAAVTPNNSYSEIDLIPSCQFNHFQLTLFDYYNPVAGNNNQFLNFRQGKNRHSLELSIDNSTDEDQHLKWMIGTFIAGDKNENTGNAYYSTYIEISYPILFREIEITPFTGLTPFHGYYANRFAFINSGLLFRKIFKLSKMLELPIFSSFIVNSHTKKSFFSVGTGIVFSNKN